MTAFQFVTNHASQYFHQVPGVDLPNLIYQVREMLRSMNDGEISISTYNTAWVALVSRLDGGDGPQFMTSVKWIINNQLPDNSWGDASLFSAYDRMMNTLACVVALTKWSLEPSKCKKGSVKSHIFSNRQLIIDGLLCFAIDHLVFRTLIS